MDTKRALSIFGISSLEDVDIAYLKTLYHKLAKEKHPDKTGGSTREFVELKRAYHLLQKVISRNQNKSNLRKLRALTKEEILDVYYRETEILQTKINQLQEQIDYTLTGTKNRIEKVVSDFESERQKIQLELDKKIEAIKKQQPKGPLKNILFFIPSYSEEKFWQNYNRQIQEINAAQTKTDLEFFKKVLDVYGNSLNRISQIIGSEESQKTEEKNS